MPIRLDDRNKIYNRDGGCLICGTTTNLTIDHILPLSKGGRNLIDNYQTLCSFHNTRKGSLTIDYRRDSEEKSVVPKKIIVFKTYRATRKLTPIEREYGPVPTNKHIHYEHTAYFLYGYLLKAIGYGFKCGDEVYYNSSKHNFVVMSDRQHKISYHFDTIKDFISDTKIDIDFNHPNIQSLSVIESKPIINEILPFNKQWSLEEYLKEPEPNFHY